MTDELLAAHHAGRVEVAIGRASDYFGPGTIRSALGETVFATALTGRTAQVMGDPDTPHSYSYTPDVAAALVTLGTRPDACRIGLAPPRGRGPHHPADHRPRLRAGRPSAPSFAAGRTTLRLLGLVKPAMREYLHTLYQFTDRWVVDDTKFRDTFGDHATPLDDALATTLQWYRHAAGPDLGPTRPQALPARDH